VEGLRSRPVEGELGPAELGHRLGVQHHQARVVDVRLTPGRENEELGFQFPNTPEPELLKTI